MSLCILPRTTVCCVALLGLALLAGCGSSESESPSTGGAASPPPAAPPPPNSTAPNQPLVGPANDAPTNAVAVAEPPSSQIPRGRAAHEEALQALERRDFLVVCAYLELVQFDPVVCDYFAKRAEGQPASLSSSTLERFLRAQNVARRSGTIVGWFEEPHSYEARVNGRSSILEVVDTRFRTTGRFTMWAMQMDDEEFETNSGRIVNVPVYLEWPLADQMLDAMRAGGDDAAREATQLLSHLVQHWNGDRHVADDDDLQPPTHDELSAFVTQRRAAAADEAARRDVNHADRAPTTTTSSRPRPTHRPREVSSNAFE